MAKLQARSQGGTEDFVVTREFRSISTPEQRRAVLRCCFAVAAVDGTIGPEEASVVNEIARELDLEAHEVNAIREEFHEQLSAVRAVRQAKGS
jgi:tellurite resistance protein